jgi:UDP-GlcNAc:undecaprenyl-phosphate GlcNAc-1-phosphate transferase
MSALIDQHRNLYIYTALTAFFVSFAVLWLISRSNKHFLSFINVESPKSPTRAKLLGGLGLSMGLMSLTAILFLQDQFINYQEKMLMLAFLISSSFLTFAGYIDDKFEIRARHKLSLQLIALSFLSFQSALYLNTTSPLITAFGILCLGFLLINGTNLIDGLDTLAVKLAIITASSFLMIGISVNSPIAILFSLATIASMAAFYFFNKNPARIYLGEIGGSLLGLIFTAQAVLAYKGLQINYSTTRTSIMILMTISYPIIELGISFLRRVYFKKSPFKGDKLHLHYILKSKSNLSVNQTTNIMALGHLFILSTSLYSAYKIHPISALIICTTLYLGAYLTYCYKEWLRVYQIDSSITICENLNKTEIFLINSSDLDKLSTPKFFNTSKNKTEKNLKNAA